MSLQDQLNALLAQYGQDYYDQFAAWAQALVNATTASAIGYGTSSSVASFATGALTLVLDAPLPVEAGVTDVLIARRDNPTAGDMFGRITAIAADGVTLTINITLVEGVIGGAGPYSSWRIQISGPRGPAAATDAATQTAVQFSLLRNGVI